MTKALANIQDHALALLGGMENGGWWPKMLATVDGAHDLTASIITVAYHALQEEREAGAELPPVEIMDPQTGEVTVNPAFEIELRQRALVYLNTLEVEAEASIAQILDDILARQLYLYSADAWGSLADFLRSLSTGRAEFTQSTVMRLAGTVLPYIQAHNLMSVQEIMELAVGGGFSGMRHLLPEIQEAIAAGQPEIVKEILSDAGSLTRSEIDKKYKWGRARVPPASATLIAVENGWQLTITMTQSQWIGIRNRLLGRWIKLEEP